MNNEKLLFQLYSQLFSTTLKFEKSLLKSNKENTQKYLIIKDGGSRKDDTYYKMERVIITNEFNITINFLNSLDFFQKVKIRDKCSTYKHDS